METTFNVLPDEIKVKIFSNLNQNDLCKASSVCQEWKNLIKSNDIWKPLTKNRWPNATLGNFENWRECYRVKHESSYITGIFTDRGKIYVASQKNLVFYTQSSPGPIRHYIKRSINITNHDGPITVLHVYSPDNHPARYHLFTGSLDKTIHVFNHLSDNEPLTYYTTLKGHEGTITSITSLGSSIIVSGSTDKTIRIWKINQKNCKYETVMQLEGHTDAVTCLAVDDDKSKNMTFIYSGSSDHTIRYWKIEPDGSSCCMQTLYNHDDCINDLKLSHHLMTLFSCSSDHSTKIWKVEKDHKLTLFQTLKEHTDSVTCLLKYPFLPILLSGSSDKTVKIWEKDIESLKWVKTGEFPEHEDGIVDLNMSSLSIVNMPETTFFTASENRIIKIWSDIFQLNQRGYLIL